MEKSEKAIPAEEMDNVDGFEDPEGHKKKRGDLVMDGDIPLNEPDHNLSVGGVYKRAWFLFTYQSGKTVLLPLIFGVPLGILLGLLFGLPPALPCESDGEKCELWLYLQLGIGIAAIVLSLLFFPLFLTALVHFTSAAHHGENISVWDALRRSGSHFFAMFFAWLIGYFGIMFGLLFLIIPGLLFLCYFGLTWVIIPIERKGLFQSMSESVNVLEGRRWEFLLVHIIFFFIMLFISFFGQICIQAIPMVESPILRGVLGFSYEIINLFLIVPYAPIVTAFYFDAKRRRREGLGGVMP